jgi:hypothetical protein
VQIRGQKKDPSKYLLDINSDGTLTFRSDGYPALKMRAAGSAAAPLSAEWLEIAAWREALIRNGDIRAAAPPSGKYCGSVPFIIDNTVTFKGDGTVDLDINVKIAHQRVTCPGEAVAVTDTQVTFTNSATTGDCMGDALRGQKKDPSKYLLDVNSDGTLTFESDGYPALKMRSC